MDAKSKANFINSVATGTTVPCPECGAGNESGSEICRLCGKKLTAASAPAFAPVAETAAPAEKMIIEETSVFANGLPEWDIVPPQVVVRRR